MPNDLCVHNTRHHAILCIQYMQLYSGLRPNQRMYMYMWKCIHTKERGLMLHVLKETTATNANSPHVGRHLASHRPDDISQDQVSSCSVWRTPECSRTSLKEKRGRQRKCHQSSYWSPHMSSGLHVNWRYLCTGSHIKLNSGSPVVNRFVSSICASMAFPF